MAKVKGFIKRHKVWFAIGAVILLAMAFLNWRRAAAAAAQPAQTLGETTILQRKDLQHIIAATGTTRSATKQEVTGSSSYKVLQVLVKVGDTVVAGQTLATTDTASLRQKIADALASIKTAEEQDALSLAQLQRKLEDAINQKTLDEARLSAEVAAAQAALDSARAAAMGPAAGAADTQANLAVSGAQTAVSDALRDYGAGSQQEADAVAALAAVQSEWATGTGPSWVAVYNAHLAADTGVAATQAAYDKTLQTRDTTMRQDSIAIENARDAVNTQVLRDSAATTRTSLRTYQEELQNASLTAPMSGMVTAVTAEAGRTPSLGVSLFTIQDTENLEITAVVPEYDKVLLQLGMGVSITSDAYLGESWVGEVRGISPAATDASGNFTVTIVVTGPVGGMAIGTSVKLNIIVEESKDTFFVPYDAVIKNEAGQTVVYVAVPESETAAARREIVVKTGMETDYYIEIISDELMEGMEIINDPAGRNERTGGTGLMFGRVG